jgi:hypothetical protein
MLRRLLTQCGMESAVIDEAALRVARAIWAAAQADEREECAKVCDARVFALDGGANEYRREATASQCAAAIRARGTP